MGPQDPAKHRVLACNRFLSSTTVDNIVLILNIWLSESLHYKTIDTHLYLHDAVEVHQTVKVVCCVAKLIAYQLVPMQAHLRLQNVGPGDTVRLSGPVDPDARMRGNWVHRTHSNPPKSNDIRLALRHKVVLSRDACALLLVCHIELGHASSL